MIKMWCQKCDKETNHFYWTCQICGHQEEGEEPMEDYPSYVNGPSEETERMWRIQRDHG
jgi:NMD protein affecting ribosome stability and mRNA decay